MRVNFGSWLTQGYANTASPRKADPSTLHEVSGRTMGTTWSVRFANPSMLPLDEVRQAAQDALDRVVRQMSHWEPDSDLSRFNRAPAGTWQALPEEFLAVMQCALGWAQATGGACDPAIGALVNCWGFGPRAEDAAPASPPKPSVRAEALSVSGWQKLALDAARSCMLQPGGLMLDLSGIAKGFSVDHVADALSRQGITDCLVEVGGELLARGQRPDGLPWRVSVTQPDAPAQALLTLKLGGRAIATSGDHWHFFEHAGRRYSHTLDPRTGEPVAGAPASVTVLHERCMDADALATAFTVMGAQAALEFAAQHDIATLIVGRAPDGSLLPAQMSSAFSRHLQQ